MQISFEKLPLKKKNIQALLCISFFSFLSTPLFGWGWGEVKPKIALYTNDTSGEFGMKRKIKKKFPGGIYNENLEKKLNGHRNDILEWAKYENTKAQHLLLYGPSGTGKTLFLEDIAGKAGKHVTYYYISACDLNRLKKEKSEEAVQRQLLRLMDKVLNGEKKAIIIIDHAHLMSDDDIEIINLRLKSFVADKVLLLFATNHLNRISQVIQSKFAKIYVGYPNENTTERIVSKAISAYHKGYFNEQLMTVEELAKKIKEKKGVPRDINAAVEMVAYWTERQGSDELDLRSVWNVFSDLVDDKDDNEMDDDEEKTCEK